MSAEPPDREHVAVIGLGYVGLPLALDLVEAGHRVHGVDTNAAKLEQLRSGSSPLGDVSAERLTAALNGGRLALSGTELDWTNESVVFVCVPTPITPSHVPDLGAVLAAAAYVRRGLKAGDLVVLQSTTYPGTTVGPFKDALEVDGLRAGVDFGLAFAPERVNPGDPRPPTEIPRVIGATTPEAATRLAGLLSDIAPSVSIMSSPDAAEMTKLFENVFRNVNIALVNELALISERLGLDVWEVIAGAATKPFGFMPFYPGPGVGGHCIPVDPYYLSARASQVGFSERFVATAGDINAQMPAHVLELVTEALNARGASVSGARILVVGVAFKPGVSDTRNTPADPIISGLRSRGAEVTYHDPLVRSFAPAYGPPLRSVELEQALPTEPDCVVIVTAQPTVDWALLFGRAGLVVDTRNASDGHRLRSGQVLRLGAGWSEGEA